MPSFSTVVARGTPQEHPGPRKHGRLAAHLLVVRPKPQCGGSAGLNTHATLGSVYVKEGNAFADHEAQAAVGLHVRGSKKINV